MFNPNPFFFQVPIIPKQSIKECRANKAASTSANNITRRDNPERARILDLGKKRPKPIRSRWYGYSLVSGVLLAVDPRSCLADAPD